MPFRRMLAEKFSPILQFFFAFPNFWGKSIPHKNWTKLIKVQWQKRQTKRTWMLTLLLPGSGSVSLNFSLTLAILQSAIVGCSKHLFLVTLTGESETGK